VNSLSNFKSQDTKLKSNYILELIKMYFILNKKNNTKNKTLGKISRHYKVCIRLSIASQEAKAVAPLSPTMGQYGLSCPDFCKKFNEESNKYLTGMQLKVIFDVLFDRTFRFFIVGVDFSSLIISIPHYSSFITVLELYQLVIVYCNIHPHISYTSAINIIMGTIRGTTLIPVL
jgi:hypothetical protein